jgi:tetratricopeptide (TPR) repeat protein
VASRSAKKLLRADHPQVALSFQNLATLRQAQGKLGEAEALLRKALSIQEAIYAPMSRDITGTLKSLAKLYDREQKPGEASAIRQKLQETRNK